MQDADRATLRAKPLQPNTVPTPAPTKLRRGLLLGAIGGGTAAAIGVRLLAAGWFGAPTPDAVPTNEIARRIHALATLGPIRLVRVAAEETEPALRSMGLTDNDRLQMQQDLIAERVRLVWLLLYDSDVEDGDAVEVESGGLRLSLVLTAKPVRVAIPEPADGRIRIIGTIDGAGGGTQNGPLGLAPLRVGETITLPVFVP